MRFHPPECVALLRELCDEHGLLLVLDEIATGFGRTGRCSRGRDADIVCVGKALTGGYMTLAARCARPPVAADRRAAHARPDVHGQPAGLRGAGVDRPAGDGGWRDDVRASSRLRAASPPARELPRARRRVLGAIGVVELDHAVDVRAATRAASTGVWLRPFRDLIYTMPPYVTGERTSPASRARGGGAAAG
jgi:adenosylmethionine-8-amino-7-oxononanoate aminotransferase